MLLENIANSERTYGNLYHTTENKYLEESNKHKRVKVMLNEKANKEYGAHVLHYKCSQVCIYCKETNV